MKKPLPNLRRYSMIALISHIFHNKQHYAKKLCIEQFKIKKILLGKILILQAKIM